MMIHQHFTQKPTPPQSLLPSLHTPLYTHIPFSRISRIKCKSSSFSTSSSKIEINGAKLKTPFAQNGNFAADSLLSSCSSLRTVYRHTPFSRISRIRCNSSSFSSCSSKNEINDVEMETPFAQTDNFAADSLLSSSSNVSPYPGGMGPFTGRDVNVKKPEWLRQKAPQGFKYEEVKETLSRLNLNTVCQEAQCPNIGEVYIISFELITIIHSLSYNGLENVGGTS